ncbi:unnamed protein product [Arabis nemorensis]|uniref:BAG domain-containing protein n=1 Tax=Arabis nemorensis TaxID=586526 RepID=A0A565BST5_9BRAS|nr:unnamed protein product [Arabis nemorensis]
MASRRHHGCSRRHNHQDYVPLIATSSCCCDSCPCCTQSNHPSPPPDNLLHLVASYLQNQQQERQCPDQTCSCETQCLRFNGIRSHQHRVLHQQKNAPRECDHIVLSCLLRKIDDLESSLNQFSACYVQRRDRHSTLRDSAARVIQTHFRSYLVRRSISFRHLKELATIKSSFLSLKSSVLGKPHFPFKAVSRKATDLLLQLDSIQGRIDPMIRNSKRSLSRDLVRFLQYIDDCAIKRFDFVSKSAMNVRFVGSGRKLRGSDGKKPQGFGVAEDRTIEKLRNRIGKRKVGRSRSRIGVVVKGNELKPRVRKPVVFDKNMNVYQLYGDTHDLTSSAEDDSVDGGEEIVMMSRDSGIRPSSKTRNMVLVKGSGRINKVGKTVSFDENGNIYKVYGDTTESSISEEDESTRKKEEEETDSENEASSSEGSEGDAIVTRNADHPGNNEQNRDIQLQKGSLMFSPPLPLKMEP